MPTTSLDPLSDLAIRHGTDKFGYHDYTPNYHKLFWHLRDKPLRLLEIGVGGYGHEDQGGQSLATWRDYFPHAQITGIDIERKRLALGDRVVILQGSQVDPDFLAETVRDRGPFDIIIDDGSHQNAHVVTSFRLLWPDLAPGGIYVAEDVQTAFMPGFGGSLTLDAPNSVGFFRDILATFDGNLAAQDVAGIERFHNMIALHKADANTAAAGIGGSGTVEFLPNAPVIRLSADSLSAAGWRMAFGQLPETGILILEGRPGPDLMADIAARFVEVDHREIHVDFPQAVIDPVARQLYAIERYPDGIVLRKGPNDYPSNFGFDVAHPQPAAAIAKMEGVLRDSADLAGLVAFAKLLTNTKGVGAAAPWLARIETMHPASRDYFTLALHHATHANDLHKIVALNRRARAAFPAERDFAAGLCDTLVALDDYAGAQTALEQALAIYPDDARFHLSMVRVLRKLGETELAIAHATQAVTASPPHRKPKAQIVLAKMIRAAGRGPEAIAILREAAGAPGPFAAQAWRALSGALYAAGDLPGAQGAAKKALALSPETQDYQAWAQTVGTALAAAGRT